MLIYNCHARAIALQLLTQGMKEYHEFIFTTDASHWEGHFDPALLRAAEERLDTQLKDEASCQVLSGMVRYRLTGDAAVLPVASLAP